jgi:hypothetical protein
VQELQVGTAFEAASLTLVAEFARVLGVANAATGDRLTVVVALNVTFASTETILANADTLLTLAMSVAKK